MTYSYPYIFNQSPEQLRRIGARGGKAQVRTMRLAGMGDILALLR